MLGSQADQGVQPIQFMHVDDFTTFRVEHATEDNALVFHFFRSPEVAKDDKYWKTLFPEVLEQVAIAHFEANYPRLVAAFTSEVDSWWLRANGFANIGEPEALVKKFFIVLDAQLEAAKSRGK